MPTIPLTDPDEQPGRIRQCLVQTHRVLRELFNGGITAEHIAADAGITSGQLGGIVGTAYTPTWTGTGSNPVLGNGTAVGEYVELGEWILGWFLITAGNTTTFGTGTYEFGLPADRRDPPLNFAQFGTARVVDGGSVGFSGFCGAAAAAAACRIILSSATTSGAEVPVSQTVPMTAADTDRWGGYFSYQKA